MNEGEKKSVFKNNIIVAHQLLKPIAVFMIKKIILNFSMTKNWAKQVELIG